MRLFRSDFFALLAILIISAFFVFDLFLTPARPSTFDFFPHITNMTQFYLALMDGDFPVVWGKGIANYGLPVSIVGHQLVGYVGALFVFITKDPLLSLKVVSFLGVFFASLFYYLFLRIYFKVIPAFAATFLYTFTTYKIINLYIRGALPEFLSAVFLPLILIGIYLWIKKKKFYGLILLSVSTALLVLTHPFTLLIYAPIYLGYLVFTVFLDEDPGHIKQDLKKKLVSFSAVIAGFVIGVGMTTFYLFPLNLEIKYFYYGQASNHLVSDNFLSMDRFFNYTWQYFTDKELITRGHIIFPGIIEIFAVVIGLVAIIYKWLKKKQRNITLLEYTVFISISILIFTLPVTGFLYERISLLANIQHPWRLLSAFMFLPPIIYACFFTKSNKNYLIFIFIILVALFQFPQLYGKNYTFFPKDIYFFSPQNPYLIPLNTIWTEETENYPVKRDNKAEIIEGEGEIVSKTIRNSKREYSINADTPLRLVDYTFYYPGWNVYVDGVNTPIEFQNPDFRGVITYQVPQGEHNVLVKLEDTKVRSISKIISLFFILLFVLLIIFRKRIVSILKIK